MQLSNRLNKHIAVAAAAAACVGAANAAVVYSGIVNLVIPANIDGMYINIETGATGATGGVTTGWDINPYAATGLSFFNATGTGMMRFPGVTTGSAGSLAAGSTVGAAGSFGSGAVVFGAAAGNWSLNASNYFGFKFVASDGLTHYGWGRMVVGATASTRTLAEYAWDNVAATGITVGIPAPGAVALMGLAGLVSRRRRA